MFKSDLQLLKKTDYQILRGDQIALSEIPRIKSLYNALYHEKHSKHSPLYNGHFFELMLKNDLLSFIALKKDGQIDALMGYYTRNGTITSPLFGYDTGQEQELGLYRMISTLLTLEAKRRECC